MLIDDLLTHRIPASICSGLPRVHEGAWPMTLEVENRYPDPEMVEQITLVAMSRAKEWVRDILPIVWHTLEPFGVVEVSATTDLFDRPATRIRLATSGWSGCEEVIAAVLSHPMMARYCTERLSGGAYVFVIPMEHA